MENQEKSEPTADEIYEAVKNEISEEELEPMKACGNDIEMLLGAILAFMEVKYLKILQTEKKGMNTDEMEEKAFEMAQDYLINKDMM